MNSVKKKIKNHLYKPLIIIFITTIISYLYNNIYVQKTYSINITLKKIINFNNDINKDVADLNPKIIDTYTNQINTEIMNKIFYEKNYDKNLIEIEKNCKKSKISSEYLYFFIYCETTKPNKTEGVIIKNFNKILFEVMALPNVIILEKNLNMRNIFIDQKPSELIVVKKNINYNKNIFKNVLKLNLIFLFVYFIYVYYLKKLIKKIID